MKLKFVLIFLIKFKNYIFYLVLSVDNDSFFFAKRPVLMIPNSKFNFGQINGLGLLEIKFLKLR